jgi:hypothetical protein
MSRPCAPWQPVWLVQTAIAAALLVPALTGAAQSPAYPPRKGSPPPPNWERQWSGVYGNQDPEGRIAPPGFTVINPRADMDDLVIPLLTPWAYARYEATELDLEEPGAICRPTGLQAAHAQRGFMLVASPARITYIGDGLETAAIRRIYFNRGHLKNPPLTYWGDSIAHWEGDTLVIDTVGFTDKTLLTLGGARHSTDLHIVERWRFVANGEYLEKEWTVDDPRALKAPYRLTRYHRKLPADTRMGERPCLDTPDNRRAWVQLRNDGVRQRAAARAAAARALAAGGKR